MKRISRPILVFLILIYSLIHTGQPATAQPPLDAQVDKTRLSTDDLVTLTVTVTAASMNPPQPSLPSLDGFDIAGTSSSSRVSIVNTKITTQGVYHYRLRPLQTGTLIIGSVSATIDGQTYTTDPITVEVTAGSNTPQSTAPDNAAPAPQSLAGQDLYIEAAIDEPNPYLGQQTNYTFRFYQGINLMDQPRYDGPTFTGFWSKQQPDQVQYTTQQGNRIYRVTELRTVLFPTIADENIIEPAHLDVPDSIFQAGENLTTNPVTVTVQPLPPNAPDEFSGAVGDFTLTAQIDTTRGKVNEPLTLIVTLSGRGNIENLPEPAWPDLSTWRAFESKATTNTQFQDGKFTGSRVYERLMVPGQAGEYTLPGLSYTFFNPETETYQTITTNPIPVNIAPPARQEPPIPVIPGSGKETVERLATDIRHIKNVPPVLKPAARPLTRQTIYRLAWLLPAVILAGNVYFQSKQAYLRQHTALARSLQAKNKALKQLTHAEKTDQDPYITTGQVLNGYLSDKLNKRLSGITQTHLNHLLAEQDIKAALRERVKIVLAESDTGRFSPGAGNPGHGQKLLRETRLLIEELETAFSASERS